MMPYYLVTLTRTGGFIVATCVKFEDWFKLSFQYCVVTRELHKSGHLHLHAVVQSKVKQASTLTARIERLYELWDIPLVKRVSINCKTAVVLEGAVQYVLKDVVPGDAPSVLCGWDMKTLEDQMLSALKKMPRSMVQRDDYYLNQRVATSLLIEYGKRIGVAILDKISFKQVVVSMMKEGYQFDAVKLAPVYVQILARSGYVQAANQWIDDQLQFL